MNAPSVEHGCWQCSGCHMVFFGPWRKECPNCRRLDYWTGSVDPKAKAEALRNLVLDRDAAQALVAGCVLELKLAAAELAWFREREEAVERLLDAAGKTKMRQGCDLWMAWFALRDYPEFKL